MEAPTAACPFPSSGILGQFPVWGDEYNWYKYSLTGFGANIGFLFPLGKSLGWEKGNWKRKCQSVLRVWLCCSAFSPAVCEGAVSTRSPRAGSVPPGSRGGAQ